ncbi:MAG: IS66 family transposase zinc-finger binding domain-containing protein [Ktedonobacteraceae bacterium]
MHEPSCTCSACGGEMRKVDEDVTQILYCISDHFEVVRYVRAGILCPRCESMMQSSMPSLPIGRGQAGPVQRVHGELLICGHGGHPDLRQTCRCEIDAQDFWNHLMICWP